MSFMELSLEEQMRAIDEYGFGIRINEAFKVSFIGFVLLYAYDIGTCDFRTSVVDGGKKVQCWIKSKCDRPTSEFFMHICPLINKEYSRKDHGLEYRVNYEI